MNLRKYIFSVLDNEKYLSDPQILHDNLPIDKNVDMIFYSDIIDLLKIYYIEGQSKLFNNFLKYILNTSYDVSHFHKRGNEYNEWIIDTDYGPGERNRWGESYTKLKIDIPFNLEYQNNEINNYIIIGLKNLEQLRYNTIISNLSDIDKNTVRMINKYDLYIIGRVEYNILSSKRGVYANVEISILEDDRVAIGYLERFYVWNPRSLKLDYEKVLPYEIDRIIPLISNIIIINGDIYDFQKDEILYQLDNGSIYVSKDGLIAIQTNHEVMIYEFKHELEKVMEIAQIENDDISEYKLIDFIDDKLFFTRDDYLYVLNYKDESINKIMVEQFNLSFEENLEGWDIDGTKISISPSKIFQAENKIIQSDFVFAVWDLTSGKNLFFMGKTIQNYLFISSDIIALSFDHKLIIFNLKLQTYIHISNYDMAISKMKLMNDQIIIGFRGGNIGLFDIGTYKLRLLRKEHDNSINRICILPDHRFITSSLDLDVKLWK